MYQAGCGLALLQRRRPDNLLKGVSQMKRMLSLFLTLALVMGCGVWIPSASAAQADVSYTLRTAVASLTDSRFLRWTDENPSLEDCGPDEFITVGVEIQNNSAAAVVLQKPTLQIDGGAELRWLDLTVPAGQSSYCQVYAVHRDCLTPGHHTAVFYAGGEVRCSGQFIIGRDWSEVFSFPTQAQIEARPADYRSPYLACWLSAPDARYDMYSVDFNSDYIPHGTYSSVFNGYLSFAHPEDHDVTLKSVFLYAGLQKSTPEKGTNSILSCWDIPYTDAAGNEKVLRPRQIYPAGKHDTFTGEGDGIHDQSSYQWLPGRWYRMLLRLGTSALTGNTTMEQWFLDRTTGQWTHTCTFDLGFPDLTFQGSVGCFSENFLKEYAGEVRSLEITNVRIHTAEGWQNVDSTGGIDVQNTAESLVGSYGSWEAGADEHSFYMISTGVSGWGRTASTGPLTMQNLEAGDPLAENPLPEETVPETMRFADVASSAYYYNAVRWAIQYGITSGTSETTFSPDITCTHGQILTFLWLSKGRPAPAGAVSGKEYYAQAVQWAKECGLTGAGLKPDAVCTRADLVTYLWKLAGSPKKGSASFEDVPEDASYAQAVAWAVQEKICAGSSATTFSPDVSCTRGQIVTFLWQAIGKGPLKY